MTAGRPSSLVGTCDQWVRGTHHHTAVDGAAGVLTLTWTLPPTPARPASGDEAGRARGLATDRLCRIYRLVPGAVQRLAVGPTGSGLDYVRLPTLVGLIGEAASGPGGTAPVPGADFGPRASGPPLDPVGIAVDGDDRLFLADGAARRVSVIDLWSRRLLRSIDVSTPEHPDRTPTGLAAHANVVLVAVSRPPGLLRLTVSRGPQELALPGGFSTLPAGTAAARVAFLRDATQVVLATDPGGESWLVAGSRDPLPVGQVTDLAVDAEGAVVVAPLPSPGGRTVLRRLAPTAEGWTPTTPLDATGYDGAGIVVTRDGRIGYFTADGGFRLSVITAVTYATEGSCTTYRLDSGTPRNRWGRVLLEACVPDGTGLSVATTSTDDDDLAPVGLSSPSPAACTPATTKSPPLVPAALDSVPAEPLQPVHRRPQPVTPWWRPDPRYDTFEAPVMAPPGRYLWVTLHLRGNERRTPRVRELRVEQAAHGLLRRLPAIFSAERDQAEFLHRYLATLDGMLHDLDLRSRCRDLLVDPHGTPAEALDWLASFLGLVLDDRWAENARRQLVAEIAALYRRRGTVGALRRYLEIYLAGDRATDPTAATVSPVIVEHFRLRGVGGPLLGGDPDLTTRSVVGAGFRVGGAVGEPGSRPLDPADDATSSFTSHAHRFTVLVPRPLGAEDEAALRRVLETERPAHTLYDLCTVESGMRVGQGLHVGLSTIVGPTGVFERAVTGQTLLGRRSILGPAGGGIAVESASVGTTARVG